MKSLDNRKFARFLHYFCRELNKRGYEERHQETISSGLPAKFFLKKLLLAGH